MSRLYGRSDDVYMISKYLIESDINEYKKDNRKIKQSVTNNTNIKGKFLFFINILNH